MKEFYTAYTKQLAGKTFYFVKRFATYTELKNVSPSLEGYGMHTDFNKACKIASVYDAKIKEQLLEEIKATTQQAKIIELNQDVSIKKKIY